jgi:hypothetical protein
MLLHSIILRDERFNCTFERLRYFDYIKGFTTLIPVNINKEGIKPQIGEIINYELQGVQSQRVDDMSQSDTESCTGDNCNPDDYNIDNNIFTIQEEPTNYDDKRELYEILASESTKEESYISALNRHTAIANLTASRVIYKTHTYNRNCAVQAPQSRTSSSSSSGVKLPPINKKGGKRTKRRRGRGKSKKRVTRRKRVKGRKTVKKIKKRRRTRK